MGDVACTEQDGNRGGICAESYRAFTKGMCFLQRWKPRLKPAEQSHLEEGERRLGGWIKDFKEKARPWPPEDSFF
jgi:tRNA U34 5-methylaminomethyl-2-thiouridine-forming methyltransferase MnmC